MDATKPSTTFRSLADDTLGDTAGSFNLERLNGGWRGVPPPSSPPSLFSPSLRQRPFNFERSGGGVGNLAHVPSANQPTIHVLFVWGYLCISPNSVSDGGFSIILLPSTCVPARPGPWRQSGLPWSPVGAPVGGPVAGAPAGVPLADLNSKESSWRTSLVKNPFGGPQ